MNSDQIIEARDTAFANYVNERVKTNPLLAHPRVLAQVKDIWYTGFAAALTLGLLDALSKPVSK